ncbi:molybdopterin-guanine dinucleotide biosynthesis protein A [Chondrocystis sp. NIES-4102]|nr:molybdopterin-guanine dinucleotide biosynthesis protein A [Chondrocystis sp. NIES-4102]
MTEVIKDEITAIILAGGESSRMGKDKALLRIGDNTLLSQICLIASECASKVYVITPWIERYQGMLTMSNCILVKEQLILDGKTNTPLIGFAQGLKLVKTEWVLLLACDLPKLSSSQVKQWSQDLATVLPTEIALLARDQEKWEPLCGFYRPCCLPLLEAYLAQGGKSFQLWLNSHPVKELFIGDRTCFFNCNTPTDWEMIENDNLNT